MSSQRSSNRTISGTREEPEEEEEEDEREEDDSRIGDFESPLPDKESESSREEVLAKMNDLPSPKKKTNPGGKVKEPAKPRIQDPGGSLPRIPNNKSKVSAVAKKPPEPKSSPKKLPQLSPSKMPRRPKKATNNGEAETNDNGPGTITGMMDKVKDGKKKRPLRKTETSLGLTEQAIKKKVEESFKSELDNVNNSNDVRQRTNNMRSSKSENELNEEDLSSLSESIDLSTPEENSLTIKRKPKKPVNDSKQRINNSNNNNPTSPSKLKKPGGPPSPSKSKPFPSSPSKVPESPSKRIANKATNSPLKSKKKFAKTASQPNISQDNNNEPGEKKDDKPWLRSPKKKKVLKKQKSETSIVDAEDSSNEKEEVENEENPEPVAPRSPSKKVKKSELVFSDEEQESPFGVSRGVRRTTYLDILKIEHERREAIKKMKEEKEKEREKRRLDETFTKDRQGNKVYSNSKSSAASSRSVVTKSNASLKSTEPELPEQIEKLITDTVENTAIISSSVNYNRNRESLVSMIRKKIKEDHFIKSLCMTDEWFMKNIIKVTNIF